MIYGMTGEGHSKLDMVDCFLSHALLGAWLRMDELLIICKGRRTPLP